MHTDIFEEVWASPTPLKEVWAPYTLIYKELWYHLNVIAQGNTSSDLRSFRDIQHTVNMYIYMRDHED